MDRRSTTRLSYLRTNLGFALGIFRKQGPSCVLQLYMSAGHLEFLSSVGKRIEL